MNYHQRITIQREPLSLNNTQGEHWSRASKRKKEWQEEAGWAIKAARIPLSLPRVELRSLVYCSTKRGRLPDPSNIFHSIYKPVCDALVEVGVIADDSQEYVRCYEPEVQRGWPGQPGQTIVMISWEVSSGAV